jgi:hypothetical protein
MPSVSGIAQGDRPHIPAAIERRDSVVAIHLFMRRSPVPQANCGPKQLSYNEGPLLEIQKVTCREDAKPSGGQHEPVATPFEDNAPSYRDGNRERYIKFVAHASYGFVTRPPRLPFR